MHYHYKIILSINIGRRHFLKKFIGRSVQPSKAIDKTYFN